MKLLQVLRELEAGVGEHVRNTLANTGVPNLTQSHAAVVAVVHVDEQSVPANSRDQRNREVVDHLYRVQGFAGSAP